MRPESRPDLLVVVPAALLLAALLIFVLAPASGPLALLAILEEHLFLAVLVLLSPVALFVRARRLGAGLAVLAVVGGCLFGSEWLSLPWSGAGRQDLTVMSWNVQYGMRAPAEQAAQLAGVDADVVALLEVEPDAAAAIEADAALMARYPYRAMAPQWGPWGLAVLSRYPVSGLQSGLAPAFLEMDVATPRGPVHLIVGHPMHADIGTVTPLRLPVAYDPAIRDAEVAIVRQRVEAALAAPAGARLLLVGDFNTAPSEAEYRVLAAGLRDTHVEVGQGPGWTWRPSRLAFLPMGWLRIDLQFSAGAIGPSSTWTDCSLAGDHCQLFGSYQVD
jgi:vancomycin resistance protein VanJ